MNPSVYYVFHFPFPPKILKILICPRSTQFSNVYIFCNQIVVHINCIPATICFLNAWLANEFEWCRDMSSLLLSMDESIYPVIQNAGWKFSQSSRGACYVFDPYYIHQTFFFLHLEWLKSFTQLIRIQYTGYVLS